MAPPAVNIDPTKTWRKPKGPTSVAAMSTNEFLSRAFELADSGKYARVSEIRAVMTHEGFSLRELSQLSGRHLSRQLKARISAANPKTQTG